MLPSHFTYLNQLAPTMLFEMKYLTTDNFIGAPIRGYEAPVCIITQQAADALISIQAKLAPRNLTLKIFDAYRPQTAVNHFIVWSEDAADQRMKEAFYPRVNKADFFELQYLSKTSSHTRGSTVDLTIAELVEGRYQDLDMGTGFDFMDELSHPLNPAIQGKARENRLLLRSLMEEAGFEAVDNEWWHFTLRNEPYPDTYFDFPVK